MSDLQSVWCIESIGISALWLAWRKRVAVVGYLQV